MASDGRSFVTSVGMRQSAVWIHDASGERSISSEGYAYSPSFAPDFKKVFYLIRKGASRAFMVGELWSTELDSGRSESVFPGVSMTGYDISGDAKRIVYAALDDQAKPYIWTASLDRRSPPRQVPSAEGDQPLFGPDGKLYFRATEGSANFVYRIQDDGTGPEKAFPNQILDPLEISPDGRWLFAWSAVPGQESTSGYLAYPIGGGPPTRICDRCRVSWSPDGRFLYLSFSSMSFMVAGRTVVLPLPPGKQLPALPPAGFRSWQEVARLPGAQMIDQSPLAPGPTPAIYAFLRYAAQRNLYRVPLP